MTTKEIDDKAWNANPFTYRNNRGCAYTEDGRYIKFGIPEPPGGRRKDRLKGGDRIGFKKILVTPEMVGKEIAVFTSIEIKGPGDALKTGQRDWHNFVIDHGGISEIWFENRVIKDKIYE